ncbi:MAG: Xaa-Pro peptidase family protein [candidate division Zixibacteria bacterium]|nr:Xaa-Pro peptidase family protein [candidate division Zixibacteria bacterium]
MKDRIKNLREIIDRENLDLLMVTSLLNLRFLCGYTGSNGVLLISRRGSFFLTDFRYKEQVKDEVRGASIKIAQRELFSAIADTGWLKQKRVKVGFEAKHLTFAQLEKLKTNFPAVIWIPTEDLVESIRIIKDEEEIRSIKKAAEIGVKVFHELLPLLKPGIREKDISSEIEYRIRRNGGTASAFESTVASGIRSAMPHAKASSEKMRRGEFVTLDYGACFQGYVCDITRTLVLGRATSNQRKIYNLVLKAQKKAIDKTHSGMKGVELDKVARDIIKKGGYDKYFGHGLGHGIGLGVHEGPSISTRSQDTLKAGMVVTIEPGVYLPGWGGVRIEDDVLIKRNSCLVLTDIEKDLIEL